MSKPKSANKAIIPLRDLIDKYTEIKQHVPTAGAHSIYVQVIADLEQTIKQLKG